MVLLLLLLPSSCQGGELLHGSICILCQHVAPMGQDTPVIIVIVRDVVILLDNQSQRCRIATTG